MTVSHVIVILLILTCQLAPKSNSHISQSFVASVYKPAFFQCYSVPCSVQVQFNFVQQCIQISTRINSTSVHTYILRLFYIASSIRIFILIQSNNSTWCQNRGCSYISSRRRICRSNPAVSCISPSILNFSTVELQFYYKNSKEGGRQQSVQSAIGSRVFRAVLPGRIFILSGSKALQAPRTVPRAVPHAVPRAVSHAVPRASKHSTQQKLHSMRPEVSNRSLWSSPCCSRRGILIIFTG